MRLLGAIPRPDLVEVAVAEDLRARVVLVEEDLEGRVRMAAALRSLLRECRT